MHRTGFFFACLLAFVPTIVGCEEEQEITPSTSFIEVSQPVQDDLVFEPHVIDFGIITGGKRSSTGVNITNTSDATISVLGAESDCGCVTTPTQALPVELAPGEDTQFDILANPASRDLGVTQRTLRISVELGEFQQAVYSLPIVMDVVAPLIDIVPMAINAQSGLTSTTLTVVCPIEIRDQIPSKIKWDGNYPILDVPRERSGDRAVVSIQVDLNGLPNGRHELVLFGHVISLHR